MSFNFPACPLAGGSTVWVYLRDSGGETQDLASQRAYVLAYCEHHQLQLKSLFEDAASPGGSVIGRDQFERMIQLAHQGDPTVQGIIFWDTKRFARNLLDSQFYKADLRRRGYKLISISDDIPENEFSIVLEAFLEWKAQRDRADISKDSKRGLAFIVGLKDDDDNYIGIMPGTPPTCFTGQPYDTGLRRNNGDPRIIQRWLPDTDAWPRGQQAFQMRAERISYKKIEAECRVFPNAKNPASSYHAFFKNEIYIGRLRYGGRIYENFVPALTTLDVWNRVQELRYHHPKRGQSWPKGKKHPKAGRTHYLLSGLCQCDFCRSAMYGERNVRANGRVWPFYLCAGKKYKKCTNSKRISAARLERVVIETISANVLNLDHIVPLLQEINQILSNTDGLVSRLASQQQKFSRLERAIANLLDSVEDHPSPDLLNRLQQRENERNITRVDLDQLNRQVASPGLQIHETFITDLLADMRASLESGDVSAQQLVLQQTVKKIEVGRDHARLHCKFPVERVCFMPPTGLELNPFFELCASFR